MQIRYLETLTNMAKSGQAKVIFMPGAEGLAPGNEFNGDNKDKRATLSPQKLAVYQSMAE